MYHIIKIKPVRIFLAGFIFLLLQSTGFAYDYHLPVEKYNLNNGLTIILEEDHNYPLVSIQVWVRSGSCFEGKFLGSGITHLVEHMVFKGKKSKTSQWIAEEMQKLGGEIDASTSKEYTQFNVTVPSSSLNEALDIVYGVIAKAEFPEEELKKEKDVILHEMDTIKDDPHRFMVQDFFSKAFSGHPYGEPVIGNKELFMLLNRENVLEYYKSRYVPRNMALVIAGDFNPNIVKRQIENLWGKLPDSFLEQIYIPYKPQVQGHIKSILSTDKNSFYMILGFYGPSIDSPDVYSMDVLAQIAGGSEESRLRRKIRDKMGLVSDISAFSHTPVFTGMWGVSADLTGSDWVSVFKKIIKEIYKFREEPVTEKELGMAKKIIIRRYISALETISGRGLDLGSNEIYTRNPMFTKRYIQGIKNVTREDLKRTAQKYFNNDNLTLVVLTPLEAVPTCRDVARSDVTSEGRLLTGLTPKTEEKIEKISDIFKGEIEKTELQNGMHILVKEDKRLPLVTIRLAALGGLLEEDVPGLSYFASRLWLKEYPDIVKEIESRGGSISAYSGFNSIGCVVEVFKDDIDLAVNSINKLIQNIKIEKDKLEVARKIQLAEIKQEEDSPYGYAFKAVKEIFFEGHPYRNSILGNEKSVSGINEENIKVFFKKYFTPRNIVISIFGDVNIEEIKNICSNTLGKMEDSVFVSKKEFPEVPVKTNNKNIQKEIEQAVVVLAYPAPSIYDKDRYVMELLAQDFSGQAGRLYRSIREKEGLAYSTGALNFNGREPGLFIFYIATKPEEVENAKKILFNEIAGLKKGGIEEDELNRIKKHLITETQESWESMSGLSLQVSTDELYGLGWDYYKKYIENIEKVTTDDIKNTANKYLRDDWYTLVIIGQLVSSE